MQEQFKLRTRQNPPYQTGTQAAPVSRWAMFSALRYRNFAFYWFGQLSSVMGQNMQWVAQSWLVLYLTDSPAMLGLAGLASSVPTIVFALVGGAAADRADRQMLLRVTQLAQALLYGLLATIIVMGLVQTWHVMVFAFFAGLIRAFDQPTRQALVPHLIPRHELPNAVALGSSVWQLSRLAGPAIAGMLIAFFDVGVTLYVASIGFLVFVMLLAFIRIEKVAGPEPASRGMLNDLFDGLRFIRRNELFYTLIAMTFLDSIFGMSYTVLLPVFARDILDVGSTGYGLLQTTSGVGALGGTLVVVWLSHSGRRGLQALIGAASFGLLIVAFAFSPWYPLSLALILLMGLANQTYMTTVNTVLQMHLPDELRGRVMGIYGLTYSLVPLGGTVSGTVAEFAGAPVAVAMGGLLVACMAGFVFLRLPRVRNLE